MSGIELQQISPELFPKEWIGILMEVSDRSFVWMPECCICLIARKISVTVD